MPQFTLPNIQTGGQITVNAGDLASAQQAAASQTGVSLAAQQGGGTFGSNTFGGGATGAGNAPGVASPGNIASPDLSGLAAFAAQTSGVTQAQLAQQKQEFDAQLAFAQQQMQQLGIPQLQINQQLAQLQQQQFQAQLSLAQQAQQYNQAATTAGLTGWYTPAPGIPNIAGQFGGTGTATTAGGQAIAGGGGSAGGGSGGGLTWNQLSQQIQAMAGGNYNDAAAKSLAQQFLGVTPQNFNGGAPLNLSQDQINQIISAGGGQPSAATGPGAAPGTATGTGFFIGTDGRIHVGTPTGTGQAGWGTPQGTLAATGWAPGTQSSNPNVFLQPPGTAPAAGAATPGAVQPNPNAPQQTLAGALQQANLTGMYQGAPTEQASEFARNLALQQGQLGQQYLSTAAQLQGPQNTFQLSNYLRGAQGNTNVPVYLQSLANNVGMPTFQATGTNAPTPQSAAGLAGQLGGTQSATPGWDYNQTLGTIQQIMGQGAQSLGPGALERLSPDELQAFGSGLGAVGGSLPAFLQQYQQSRVGQQAPVAQTSLA
jgi:hypothetical protein